MLTGQLPYEADTPAGFIYKHIYEPVPSVLAIRSDLPSRCEAIITRAMAKQRDARYTTASEMAAALKAVMDGQPSLSANHVAPSTAILPSEHPKKVHQKAAAPHLPSFQTSSISRWLLPVLESGTTIQLTNSGGQIHDWRLSWGP